MSKPIRPSCVYCIVNLKTGNKYVGSTTNLSNRKRQHIFSLRKGNHYSKLMQREYKKFGEESFKFVKIEDVLTFDRLELYSREQYWIDTYKPEYNNSMIAGDVFPSQMYTQEWKESIRKRMTGRKQSQEEKDKRAESIKQFWATHPAKVIPQEMREHLSKINTGKGNPNWGKKRSKETLERQSNGRSNIVYTFKSPDGEVISFRNLLKHPLPIPYSACRRLYRGVDKEYKGWIFVESHKR